MGRFLLFFPAGGGGGAVTEARKQTQTLKGLKDKRLSRMGNSQG